jgi:hypothetical protein
MVCRSYILVSKGIFPYNFSIDQWEFYGKHFISCDTKPRNVDSNF